MTTVVVVDDAEEQLGEIHEWWVVNRTSAPTLVLDEFERCVSLLESSPDIGTRFHRSRVPGVRRLVMAKTKHYVYYVHDEANSVVYIIAVGERRRREVRPSSIRADRDRPPHFVRSYCSRQCQRGVCRPTTTFAGRSNLSPNR